MTNYKFNILPFICIAIFATNCAAQSSSSVRDSFLLSINMDYQDNTLSEWKPVDFDNLLKSVPETFYKSFSIKNKYFIEKINTTKFNTDVFVDSAIHYIYIKTVNDFLLQEDSFKSGLDSSKIHLVKGFSKSLWTNYKKTEASKASSKINFLAIFKQSFIKTRKALSRVNEKALLDSKNRILTQAILLSILNTNKSFTNKFFSLIYESLTFSKDFSYLDYTHFITQRFNLLLITREQASREIELLRSNKFRSIDGYKDPDMLARNYALIDSLYKNWDLEKCSFFMHKNSDIKIKEGGYIHYRYIFDNNVSKTNSYYGVLKIYYDLIRARCIITKIEFNANNTGQHLMTAKDFAEFTRSNKFITTKDLILHPFNFIGFDKSLSFLPMKFNKFDFLVLYDLTPDCKNYTAPTSGEFPPSIKN